MEFFFSLQFVQFARILWERKEEGKRMERKGGDALLLFSPSFHISQHEFVLLKNVPFILFALI